MSYFTYRLFLPSLWLRVATGYVKLFVEEPGYTFNVYGICEICRDTVCHLYSDGKKMAYEYNPKTYYAPFGKHPELIAVGDLGKLKIVVRDYNERVKASRLNWLIQCLINRTR